MKQFEILDEGTPVAIVFADGPDSPSVSMSPHADADLMDYRILSYYDEPGNNPQGDTRLSPAQYARLLGGNGAGTYRELDDDGVPVTASQQSDSEGASDVD